MFKPEAKEIFHLSSKRSSRQEVLCKNGVLRNFAKFTGKYLWQSFFFNKVPCLRPATLLKKRLWHRCFPVNFCEISKNTYSYRTPPVAASVAAYEKKIQRSILDLIKHFSAEKDVTDIGVNSLVNSIIDVWQGLKYASELPLIFLTQLLAR